MLDSLTPPSPFYKIEPALTKVSPVGDYNEAAYWSTIEMHVGIVCACLPALRALFVAMGVKVLGTTKGTTKASGYSTGNSSKHGGRSGTFGGGGGGGSEKLAAQGVPRHGDESDFVPLVEMNSRSKTPVGMAISENGSVESHYHAQQQQQRRGGGGGGGY